MDSLFFQNLSKKVPSYLEEISGDALSKSAGSSLTLLGNLFKDSANVCSAFSSAVSLLMPELPDDLFDASVEIDMNKEVTNLRAGETWDALWEVFSTRGEYDNSNPQIEKSTLVLTTPEGDVVKLEARIDSRMAPTVFRLLYARTGDNGFWTVFHESTVASDHHDSIWTFRPFIPTYNPGDVLPNYKFVSIVDLCTALMENANLSSAYYNTVCSLLSGSKEDMASRISNLSATVDTAWDSVKQTCSDIFTSWNTGGVYGVIRYIHDMVKGNASVSVSDGKLQFTDASTLVPQAYFSGIISTLGNSLSMIAGALVAIWNPVVGMLTSAIGSIITSLFGRVSYAMEVDEKVRINDSQRCVGSLAPYFEGRCRLSLTSSQASNIKRVFPWIIDNNVCVISVPGGQLIQYCDGDSRLDWEFHPDIVDRRAWSRACRLIKDGNNYPTSSFKTIIDYSLDPDVLAHCYRNRVAPHFDGSYNYQADGYESTVYNFDVFWPPFNETTGSISDADGYEILSITIDNLMIFMYWIQSICGNSKEYIYNSMTALGSGLTGQLRVLSLTDFSEYDTKTVSYVCDDMELGHQAWLFFSLLNWQWYYLNTNKNYTEANNATAVMYNNAWRMLGKMCESVAKTQPDNSVEVLGEELLYSPFVDAGGTLHYPGLYFRPEYDDMVDFYRTTDVQALSRTGGCLLPLLSSLEFVYTNPKYDPGSTIRGVILASIIAVSAVTVIAVAKFSIGKRIAIKRTQLTAKAEKAWNAATAEPTTENIKAYRKAVFKNNAFSKIFGGSCLSKSGYWDSPAAADGETVTSRLCNLMSTTSNSDSPSDAFEQVLNKIDPNWNSN